VVRTALAEAKTDYSDLSAIAATIGPGLVGSLLVGLTFAKALSFARGIPLIGVNHVEGHIHAAILNAQVEFPAVALIVSGGHTHLFEVNAGFSYKLIGKTRDDAAGEAFDKVAKLLELGYPGGPIIDFLAPHGNAKAVNFPFAQIKHRDRNPENRHEPDARRIDFSYSGIKTAVLRYVELHDMHASIEQRRGALRALTNPMPQDYLAHCDKQTLDLVASFQRAMVNDLISKTLAAAEEYSASTLLVTGGVAANSELRAGFERQAHEAGLAVYFPSRKLSTDNAAMIAAAAYPRYLAGEFAEAELSAEAGLRLR